MGFSVYAALRGILSGIELLEWNRIRGETEKSEVNLQVSVGDINTRELFPNEPFCQNHQLWLCTLPAFCHQWGREGRIRKGTNG